MDCCGSKLFRATVRIDFVRAIGTSSSEELFSFLAKYEETFGIGGRIGRSNVCREDVEATVPVVEMDDMDADGCKGDG